MFPCNLQLNEICLGRTVHIEKKELPECLKRARPSGWSCDTVDGTYLSQLLIGLLIVGSIIAAHIIGSCDTYLCAIFTSLTSMNL